MIVTCQECKTEYDDVDHWTSCPHEYFPMRTVATRSGVTRVFTNIDELEKFLE